MHYPDTMQALGQALASALLSGCTLWTLDKALARAARTLRVG
jgi:predicted nucleic acid-binding protein